MSPILALQPSLSATFQEYLHRYLGPEEYGACNKEYESFVEDEESILRERSTSASSPPSR